MATQLDMEYMRRALSLASRGAGHTRSNPMVGCVIVADGRIIGEGYHRKWGGPHAEVNAVDSVKDEDRHLLGDATVYVTLEPCAHYGKTPPCAELLCRVHPHRVVIGTEDPFSKVRGRGIGMLRDAGIDVEVRVLTDECLFLNRRFFTAHTHGRPYVQLKWAQTSDGFMAHGEGKPLQISNPVSQVLMHRERSMAGAIIVGTDTANNDNPRLDLRLWHGAAPLRVTFDRTGRLRSDLRMLGDDNVLIVKEDIPLAELLKRLYTERGIISVMVEGGATLLRSFIAEGLFDEIRVETSPMLIGEGLAAPDITEVIEGCTRHDTETVRSNRIDCWYFSH